MGIKVTEEEQKALKDLIKELESEERTLRDSQIRSWKLHDYFWRGVQTIFWSEVARDWQSPQTRGQYDPTLALNPYLYNKVINIYRSHGEAVISALSASVPHTRFFPDDADKPEDITTAKAASRISELIQIHNLSPILFTKALFILFNQGLVFAYNCHHKSQEYGSFPVPIQEMVPYEFTDSVCQDCNASMPSSIQPLPIQAPDMAQGGMPTSGLPGQIPPVPDLQNPQNPNTPEQMSLPNVPPQMQNSMMGGMGPNVGGVGGPPPDMGNIPPSPTCPECGSPNLLQSSYTEEVPATVNWDEAPKGRELIEVFGPLNVKVPHYIHTLKDSPYIILETEQHSAMMKDLYPDIETDETTDSEKYDRWARSGSEYSGDANRSMVTVRRAWLRNWAFNKIGDNKSKTSSDSGLVKSLKKKFPNGVYVVLIDDEFAEAIPESMDDHWTLTISPISQYIHADPIGKPLIPIQEMRNELVELTMETIKYGIPETFADPEVLDFKKYGEVEAEPGLVFPVTPKNPDKNIGDSFFSIKTTTLSKEVKEFGFALDQDARFVVGSFPSIYGGPAEGGSKTLGEYEMSRNQALQRLSIYWKMINVWWSEVMKKSVKSYIENVEHDEKLVKPVGSGFVNIWIHKSELEGSIGEVEPETTEEFPVSWSSKRAVLMDLLGLGIEPINMALLANENVELISRLIGIPELKLPGEADREKQLEEIAEMLKGTFIPPEPNVDNAQIHIQTIRDWAVSDEGRDTQKTNPQGYGMVMQHLQYHIMSAMMNSGPTSSPDVAGNGGGTGADRSKEPGNKGELPNVSAPKSPNTSEVTG
jgi:hypothetical protein